MRRASADAVEALIAELRHGPPMAEVEDVSSRMIEPEPERPASECAGRLTRERIPHQNRVVALGRGQTSATGQRISSSMRRTYLIAWAGSSAQLRAPAVVPLQPSISS